ncbi:hypothetical protein R5R35_007858 [Gryllus longicercus]|uniref:Uncharacterized protein n=1 Tax=Gryllus longicercus TaxID=2509291 RepID=A0AAN9VIE3_9ORTH
MYLTRGSLLLKRFNELLGLIAQSGFIDHWWEALKRQLEREAREERRRGAAAAGAGAGAAAAPPADGDAQVLTLHHLQGAFALLGLGLAIAWVVFAVGQIARARQRLCGRLKLPGSRGHFGLLDSRFKEQPIRPTALAAAKTRARDQTSVLF